MLRTLRRVPVLIATSIPAMLLACGDTTHTDAPDGDRADSAVAETRADSARVVDTTPAPADDGSLPPKEDLGKICTTDDVCDVTGDGVNVCSNGFSKKGTLWPTPVCVGKTCDAGDGTSIKDCNGGTGVCVGNFLGSGSATGVCVPLCTFDDTGGAPKGCEGKDACNVYGWGKPAADAGGGLEAVGYCFGGCRLDTDCTGGDKCQIETGLCYKALDVYTLGVGDACTKADGIESASPKCNCHYAKKEGTGYCSRVCRYAPGDLTASGACTAGFSCDPELPKMDATGPLFTKAPSGIVGHCLKNCVVDADCTALNAYCEQSAGLGTQKTCHVGTRP